MFGNLMTNSLIQKKVKEGSITLTPFEPERLQYCHYRLTPARIVYEVADGPRFSRKTHSLDDGEYEFAPLEYVLVVPRERIILPDGVVGLFVPESRLIEKGFGVTTGKLDPGYGRGGEELRFGLQNNLGRKNKYKFDSPLVHLQLFDTSGLGRQEVIKNAASKSLSRLRQRENAEKLEEDLDEIAGTQEY